MSPVMPEKKINSLLLKSIISKIIYKEDMHFNPVLLYGGSPQTYDHSCTLKADYLSKHPKDRVVRVSGEALSEMVIRAKKNAWPSEMLLKQQLISCDLMILTELSYIAGKTATEETLYIVLDRLLEKGKRIVVAAEDPAELSRLPERIRSILAGGLLVEV